MNIHMFIHSCQDKVLTIIFLLNFFQNIFDTTDIFDPNDCQVGENQATRVLNLALTEAEGEKSQEETAEFFSLLLDTQPWGIYCKVVLQLKPVVEQDNWLSCPEIDVTRLLTGETKRWSPCEQRVSIIYIYKMFIHIFFH